MNAFVALRPHPTNQVRAARIARQIQPKCSATQAPRAAGRAFLASGLNAGLLATTGVPDTAQAAFGFPNFNERHQPISKQVEEKTVNALENLNEQ
jgi:hypothetical protein